MVSKLLPLLPAVSLVFFSGCSSYGSLSPSYSRPLAQAGMQRHVRNDGEQQRIKHIVVIVQENRSFENFFAGYPGANAPTSGCAKSRTPAPQSRPAPSGSCPPGDTSVPLHQVTFTNNPDLAHNWGASMKDWDGGKMDGFSLFGAKPTYAYAYMNRKEIAPYWTMAQQYVLADAMFPTEFGGSFTAHLTLIAGTDELQLPSTAEVDFPNAAPDDCDSPPGTKSS